MLAVVVVLWCCLVCKVTAWGEQGHETVGYVAQAFLNSGATAFVNTFLDPSYRGSLGPAAVWADQVRRTHGYTWSAPYHFVDAHDSPTSGTCSVDQDRDCGEAGCILSAIANYTARIQDASLDDKQRDEALKFLTHFLGDITQPLHDEAYERGANEVFVEFNGRRENLHAVWDDYIIQLHLKQNHKENVQAYAKSLVQRITSGDLASSAPTWISCIANSDLRNNKALVMQGSRARVDRSDCPVEWARDANIYDCSFVFDYEEGKDLVKDSNYFTNAIPIVDLQLAKGGFRLAAWLNGILDDSGV